MSKENDRKLAVLMAIFWVHNNWMEKKNEQTAEYGVRANAEIKKYISKKGIHNPGKKEKLTG